MTPSRPKFLDPRDVDEALLEVSRFEGIDPTEIAVVGGVAMMLYGSDRMTKDVDVAAYEGWDLRQNLRSTRDLSFGGFSGLTKRGHRVDVVVRSDEYRDLYAEAVERAGVVGDLPVKVVSPEYLAALKMAAARPKDQEDLRTLVRLGVLDLAETRKVVRKHLGEYAARELDSVVAEVEWRRGREGDE